jgi:hypothetical protein
LLAQKKRGFVVRGQSDWCGTLPPARAALPALFFGDVVARFLVGVAMGATWSGFLFWCMLSWPVCGPGRLGGLMKLFFLSLGCGCACGEKNRVGGDLRTVAEY